MSIALESAAAEIEAHVGAAGWDQPPALFALVRSARFAADEPQAAARLGIAGAVGDALVPIEQDALPHEQLDEALAGIEWPTAVEGCALAQEIIFAAALDDPDRREARLVVAVLRDGSTASLLRLRDQPDDLLTGPELAPNLVHALLATLR